MFVTFFNYFAFATNDNRSLELSCLKKPLLPYYGKFTLYFSSFTKAKGKVYNTSSPSSSLSLSEVMSISSPLISAKIIALISFL